MASCSGGLAALPDLVFDAIVDCLDLGSIKSLRLTCKLLSQRCLTRKFGKCCRAQSTDLSEPALDRLVELASHERLGPFVQDLTIFAIVIDPAVASELVRTKTRRVEDGAGNMRRVDLTPEELDEAEKDVAWLERQQLEVNSRDPDLVIARLATALKKLGRLAHLRLDVRFCQDRKNTPPPPEGYRGGPRSYPREWYQRFVQASRTFRIVMSAIAQGRVELESLAVFKDTVRCGVESVDVTHLLPLLEEHDFASAVKHVKDLSLGLATRLIHDWPEKDKRDRLESIILSPSYSSLYGPEDAEVNDPENFTGLADLLAQFPSLEKLDLRLYNTMKGRLAPFAPLFERVASEVCFPSLVEVSLRGLSMSEEALIRFLQRHPRIRTLTLHNVHLSAGTPSAVFEYLAASMPDLEILDISSFWGPTRLTNVEPVDHQYIARELADPKLEDESSYPCDGGSLWHSRTIGTEEIKAGLRFRPVPGPVQGSLASNVWLDKLRRGFGPP